MLSLTYSLGLCKRIGQQIFRTVMMLTCLCSHFFLPLLLFTSIAAKVLVDLFLGVAVSIRRYNPQIETTIIRDLCSFDAWLRLIPWIGCSIPWGSR